MDALAVQCPTCHAKPGQLCTAPVVIRQNLTHWTRDELAYILGSVK